MCIEIHPIGSQITKNPADAGFSLACHAAGLSGGLQRFNACGEAALVASGFIAMNQAARGEAIEYRLRCGKRLLRTLGVVRIERLEYFLDGSAQLRTLRGIAGVAHDILLSALFGGLDIGHRKTLEDSEEKVRSQYARQIIMAQLAGQVNEART